MRARHPDLFSDTKIIEGVRLDRAVLDHHLETLTNRKQELAFERFARKLAEKEICRNLVPQTGPTGGGDSKVDSETYPVSQDIADRWYEGQPKEAAGQRWAFAFSTKKTWKAKLEADVNSIASTGRGYVRVYFITSRFVKDKDRGKAQDDLRKQYGFDVEIFDRTWILEKVFTNRREELAVETLELDRPLIPITNKGPLDTRREAELAELEHEIDDSARYEGIEYQLVEDCLQAALLSRGLERPRIEVDGRFDRASRIAERYGTRQQQLRVAYNRAWTLFWWYEEYLAFAQAYDEVEQFADGTTLATDLELLKNCWQLLYTAVNRKVLDAEAGKLSIRTATLKQELKRLINEEDRPNNSLHARAQHLLIDLIEARGKEAFKKVLTEFTNIFKLSEGLVSFPARQLIELMMEVGELFPVDAHFDEIFEQILALAQKREASATAGRMLLRRGMQKLEHGEPYESIRLLGRAHQHLALRECRGELATALASCARAYESAGLMWTARASMLFAANQALTEFWEKGRITRQALACLRHLAWLELQIGHVPGILAWLEASIIFSHTIKLDSAGREQLHDELTNLDFALGLLLLKTEFFDLRDLTHLPPVLERFGLNFSWIALLYALGHEDKLRSDKLFAENETPEQVLAHFSNALEKVSPGDLPAVPEFLERRKIELRSSVLGCNLTVGVPNQNRSLFLAESVLAALEAFLATSLDADVLPFAASLRLEIIPTDFLSKPLEWKVVEGQELVELRHTTDDHSDPGALHDLLPELIISLACQLAVPADLRHIETLFRDEQAMGRAIHLTNGGTHLHNILGADAKLRLSDWTVADAEAFPLRRAEPWNSGQLPAPKEITRAPPIFGTGDPPPELLDTERQRHGDRKVVSLINLPLWSRAGWKGAGFVEYPGHPEVPPVLALLFEDKDAGKKIFAGWRKALGDRDNRGKLQITVITGIDRKNPAHYRLLICPKVDWDGVPRGSHFIVVSRSLTVTPSSTANLDRFLTRYRKDGVFLLAPGHAEAGDTVPTFDTQLLISSSSLTVRPAWEIGENEPDVMGIQPTDDVVIPDGIENPPILQTLERIKKRRRKADEEQPRSSVTTPMPKIRRNDPCPCGSGKKFKKCHGR